MLRNPHRISLLQRECLLTEDFVLLKHFGVFTPAINKGVDIEFGFFPVNNFLHRVTEIIGHLHLYFLQ